MFRFEAEEQAVSVFVMHECFEEDPRQYILKAVGASTLKRSNLELTERPGPTLGGLPTTWRRWQVMGSAPDAVVPPCLAEDPDDLAFSVREGLVVTVDGSPTMYVVCAPTEEMLSGPRPEESVCRLASHPFFAPIHV